MHHAFIRFFSWSFVLFVASALAPAAAVTSVSLGRAAVPLEGPWRFHTGDDPRWSLPSFDDSAWETVDLTPAPGSHDGDVGLPGYVPGWWQRGHKGYTGYAWYRLDVVVDASDGAPLALAGPTLVDSAYELYLDGQLIGSSGDFSGPTPTVYGVRPTVYRLPPSKAVGPRTLHLAFRVWMDPLDAAVESGGLHVAPILGTAESIDALYQVQWLKTFVGYVVDAAEPMAFLILAVMVLALAACRTGVPYGWMVVALVTLAWLRVNQVLFYWIPGLSLHHYDFVVTVLLRPFVLGAWALTWMQWFGLGPRRWLPRAIGMLSMLYFLAALVGRPWLFASGSVATAADAVVSVARMALAMLYAWIIGMGVKQARHGMDYVGALAAVLVGIGLFATELNLAGIPGIWFPYGVGVARGQFAYAAFIPLMFAMILMRFIARARKA
jgi:hypothetical protein